MLVGAILAVGAVLASPIVRESRAPSVSRSSIASAHAPSSQRVKGSTGTSKKWHSSWINLDAIEDFRQGERLKLRVGGKARKIIVRFLPQGEDSGDPVGVDGGALDVPPDGIVIVTLEDDHPRVEQISIHGGANPFGLYPLGEDNGDPILQSVHRVN
jgi:hypothetical protein